MWTFLTKTVLIHRDSETDLTINHLTTSPVTNHVCEVNLLLILYNVFTTIILHIIFQFFPESKGQINERYSYEHQVQNIGPNFPKNVPKKPVTSFHLFFLKVLQSLGVNQKEKMGPKNIGETKFHVKLLQSLGANQRNYAEIQIAIEPEFSVIAQLKVQGV